MTKTELYDQLAAQLSSLLAGERDLIANAANFSSLIFQSLPDLNWAGFYFEKDGELVLGPFQGRPACVRIRIGHGVCGAGAAKGETVIVPYTSGEIFALRAQNGQVGWSDVLSRSGHVTALSALDDIAGRPVIDRGVVYAVSQSGLMAAFSVNTGERLWSRDIGGIQTPWAAGDFVYVIDNNARLICLTRKEGRVRWIHQLPQYENLEKKADPIIWAGPVLVSDKLIAVSSNGYAEAVSPYDGKLTGRVEIPDGTNIAPVVANGILYLYTSDAELVALR